jgi:hypothetical protein
MAPAERALNERRFELSYFGSIPVDPLEAGLSLIKRRLFCAAFQDLFCE